MTDLSINLNKICLIRNSREGDYPSVIDHAEVCINNGADGITVHPRPDQRHIRPKDVRELAKLVYPIKNIEFNVEGNPFAKASGDYPGFINLIEETQPDQCTLVPDTDDQLTSDHGFDINISGEKLAPIVSRLKNQGIRVSLFMDPNLEQIRLAAELGIDRVELYTGPYAAACGFENITEIFLQHQKAAQLCESLEIGVNAGHDLNLNNLELFSSIPNLIEVSIGHAFIVDSISMGMVAAIRAYNQLLK
jgi:pyridoxine 5-phosphate synthase